MNPPAAISDSARVEFLLRLDDAEFDLRDADLEFLDSFLKRPDCRTAYFSPRQRVWIDDMLRRYLPLMPAPVNAPPITRQFPGTHSGRCQFLVRPDAGGPQARCGKLAVERTSLGAEYCAEHRDLRAEFARRNREIAERRLR